MRALSKAAPLLPLPLEHFSENGNRNRDQRDTRVRPDSHDGSHPYETRRLTYIAEANRHAVDRDKNSLGRVSGFVGFRSDLNRIYGILIIR